MSQSKSASAISSSSMQMAAIRLKSANKNIFRALLSLASAALLVRVFGMLNQVIVSSHFGAGTAMDAYFVASALPTLIPYLIIGAVEASVIPVYVRMRSGGDKKQVNALFSTLLNLLLIGSIALVIVMLIFRHQLILLSAPGLDASQLSLADYLTPFIYPAIILMVLLGFLEAVFNAEGQFGWPAYAGLLVPLTTVILVLVLGETQGVVILCIGTVLGLCLQLGVFTIRAKRAKLTYRPVLALRTPEVRMILIMASPVLIGSLISQGSPLVDQIFASSLSVGSISSLSYALKIISVFSGVIFASVGRAALPYLSRQAAAFDMKAFKETLCLYLWVVGIGTTIISVLLIIFAHPVVRVLFQRGAFSTEDTNRTAKILIGFLIGLTPMAFGFITSRAFSALGKTRVLMAISIFSVFANALFDYVFAHFWQGFGISLATSAVYLCTMCILLYMLSHMIGSLHLLTPPPAIVKACNQYYSRWLAWIEDRITSFSFFATARRNIARVGLAIALFAMGVVGSIQNSLYTLRVSFGLIIVLAFLRYHYVLLMSWALLNAFIGSSLQIFNGNNFVTALTIPTLLLMTCMPVGRILKRVPVLAFLLLFLLWVFAGIGISSIGIGAFLTQWLIMLDFLAVALLTINTLTTQRRLLGLIDAILIPATFVALYGIYGYFTKQNVQLDPSTGLERAISIYASPPGLALYLSLMIPLTMFRTYKWHGMKRLLGILLVFIFLLAAGVTFTRIAFISIPLSMILMILLLPSRKLKISLLSSFVAVAIVVVLVTTVAGIPILGRFLNQDVASINGRTLLWQALLENFKPTQLLGNGLMASETYLTYLHIGVNGHGLIANSPSSLYIGTLYDHGIIGLILIVLVFIALAVTLYRGFQKSKGDQRILFIVALAALVNVFLQSFEANDVWSEAIGIYFWIIVALPFAICWIPAKRPSVMQDEIFDRVTELRLPAMEKEEKVQIFS